MNSLQQLTCCSRAGEDSQRYIERGEQSWLWKFIQVRVVPRSWRVIELFGSVELPMGVAHIPPDRLVSVEA